MIKALVRDFQRKHNLSTQPIILGRCALFVLGLSEFFGDVDVLCPGLQAPIKEVIRQVEVDAGGVFLLGDEDLTQEVISTAVTHETGLLLMCPKMILRHKKFMNRPKDQEDIARLEAYLK